MAAALATLTAAATGHAAPVVTAPPAPPTAEAETPASWRGLPRADQAGGVVRDEPTSWSERLLWVPRVVLFVPRWAFWLAAQPLRGAAWAAEKLHLASRFDTQLFDQKKQLSLRPAAKYETGFGITLGLRVIDKNLFGLGERARLRFDFGGTYRQAYGITIAAGNLETKGYRIELDARYQRRPRDAFFGIGNENVVATPPPALVDPTMEATAFETRFRQDVARARVTFTVPLPMSPYLTMSVSEALTQRRFSGDGIPDDDTPIDEVYAAGDLAGFGDATTSAYGEAEIAYDSRRSTTRYQTDAIDSTGWYINGYLGGAIGIDDDRTDYFRYGAEVQKFIDLDGGTRVLALRAMAESIGGTTIRDGEIAIPDLPQLGGVEYLRGYRSGRFRDRAFTLATAEYTWDLGNYLAGYVFVDTGRVWRSLADVDLDGWRVGYGGGVQVHSNSSFLMRAQVAASAGGDISVEVTFQPVFGRRERIGRYY